MTGSARRVGLAAVVLTCSIQALLVGWSATGAAVAAPSGRSANRSDPSGAQIVHSRFVSTVKLDGGVVTIRPAPLSLHPRSQLQVEDQVWATSQLMSYRPQAFGFGLVTITEHAAGVPPVVDLPAWVGLASDAQIAFSCPMTRTAPTQPDPTLPTPGDAAVVVGSSPGSPAVVYRARSEPCGSVVPSSLTNAQETLSVPWSPDGTLNSEPLNVLVVVPPCGGVGGISTGGSAAAMTITVYALVPESPVAMSCTPRRLVDQTVILGPGRTPGAPPPLVSSSTQILHGDLGPVRVVGANRQRGISW